MGISARWGFEPRKEVKGGEGGGKGNDGGVVEPLQSMTLCGDGERVIRA